MEAAATLMAAMVGPRFFRVPCRFTTTSCRPGVWKVAVVGSGPAGFYTADALIKGDPGVHVDIYDRLPVPFGLVRYGVAPDHPEVKNVTERFTGVAKTGRVRFLGNVAVGDGTGTTVRVDELAAHYSAVVLACGADGDRVLNLPGEDLQGVHSARSFVSWYNGHPDGSAVDWDLTLHDTAVIIGQGNVALDVARVLLKPIDDLAHTDITSAAIRTLSKSTIRRVLVAGRRGPLQAAFTTKELRELTHIEGCGLSVDLGHEDALSPAKLDQVKDDRPRRRQAELLCRVPTSPPDTLRLCSLVFHRNPVAFLPSASDPSRLGAVEFELTKVVDGRAVSTGRREQVPCGYVFRSIGYQSSALPGAPFDSASRRVPTAAGRVVGANGDAVPGLYASGWYKRGPTGVILSNIGDAQETALAVLQDYARGELKLGAGAIDDLLVARGIRVVDFEAWERIDEHERAQGEAHGKRLEKVISVDDMLRLALPSA